MGTIARGKVQRGDLANWDGKTATATRVDATGGTITGLAVGNEVDILQVYGSGTSRTIGTISSAMQKLASSNVALVFATGTWTIDDDLTIPSNFTCHVPAGCLFDVASGKTLTINGHVQTGIHQIFSGSGTVSGFGKNAAVYPNWWTENTTPGTTDMIAAFNNAVAQSKQAGGASVTFSGINALSATITIDGTIAFGGEGKTSILTHTGSDYVITLPNAGQNSRLTNFVLHGASAAGGIKQTNAHRTHFSGIFAGKGLGGKAFHNVGSILCDYDDCLVTSDGHQYDTGGTMPVNGFYFEPSASQTFNQSVLRRCHAVGCTGDGLFATNDANGFNTAHQGFIKAYGCDFEGNGTTSGYDINLTSSTTYPMFGGAFVGCHAEGAAGVKNVHLKNVFSCHFSDGFLGDVDLEARCLGNTFDHIIFNDLTLDADAAQNKFTACFLDWGGKKTVDLGTDNVFEDCIGRGGYTTAKTLSPANARDDGAVINVDGQFHRWANSLPHEWAAYGGATLAKETTIKHGSSASLKITTVSTTDRQGAAFSINTANKEIPNNSFINISGWIYKPSGHALSPTIFADLGFFHDPLVIAPADMPDDDWFHFSTGYIHGGTTTGKIIISPGRSPTGGEIIYVDDVTISVGRHGVTNYKQHPAWQKEYFLYRNAAPQTKAIQITAASAAPTSGEYLVGDIIFNDSAAASGKIGWVCTTAGTAGSGAVFKPFGAIDA